MTNLPARFCTAAPAGAFSSAAGPTHVMRPSVAISAEFAHRRTAAAVDQREIVQDEHVGCRSLLRPAQAAPRARRGRHTRPRRCVKREDERPWRHASLRPLPGLFQQPLRARRIEHAARAEPGQHDRRLLGRPAPFLYPVDHLLRERLAHHAVPAHRRRARARRRSAGAPSSLRIRASSPRCARNARRVAARRPRRRPRSRC